MESCPKCETETSASANYCSACGTRLANADKTPERHQFWRLIDNLVDVEIETLKNRTTIDLAPGHLRDNTVFALKVYVIGFVKGLMYVVVLNAAREWEDQDFEDLDLSPIYERIVERVDEQEAEIEAALQPDPE